MAVACFLGFGQSHRGYPRIPTDTHGYPTKMSRGYPADTHTSSEAHRRTLHFHHGTTAVTANIKTTAAATTNIIATTAATSTITAPSGDNQHHRTYCPQQRQHQHRCHRRHNIANHERLQPPNHQSQTQMSLSHCDTRATMPCMRVVHM